MLYVYAETICGEIYVLNIYIYIYIYLLIAVWCIQYRVLSTYGTLVGAGRCTGACGGDRCTVVRNHLVLLDSQRHPPRCSGLLYRPIHFLFIRV